MVITPKTVKKNRDNGMLSTTKSSDTLIVLRGHKAGTIYEDHDVCLDHINRVNKIPLSINTDIAYFINNSWKDLAKKRTNESMEDYRKRVKAFKRYDLVSKDVVTALTTIRDRFWLTHKYDRRGRVYCQGYHVTYQGNSWNKAMIEFANKEKLNDN